jgi:hypothetical protein
LLLRQVAASKKQATVCPLLFQRSFALPPHLLAGVSRLALGLWWLQPCTVQEQLATLDDLKDADERIDRTGERTALHAPPCQRSGCRAC